MECPKCARQIAERSAVECPACGVVLRKAMPERPRGPTVHAEPPAAAKAGSSVPPRVIFLIAVIAVALAYGLTNRHRQEEPAAADGWYVGAEGYERALAEQSGDRPLFLVFDTDWCKWCKKLDEDVFASAEFKQRYASMLKVRVNAESTGPNRNLALQFGVNGFPVAYVIRRGRSPQSISGYAPLPDYMAQLDALVR